MENSKLLEMLRQREKNIKNKYLHNVIDSCKYYEKIFTKFRLYFDFSLSNNFNSFIHGESYEGFHQSPFSNTVYVDVLSLDTDERGFHDYAKIRISDHGLNSWNYLTDNVSLELFTRNRIIQFNYLHSFIISSFIKTHNENPFPTPN